MAISGEDEEIILLGDVILQLDLVSTVQTRALSGNPFHSGSVSSLSHVVASSSV